MPQPQHAVEHNCQIIWRMAIVCTVAFCINCQPSEPYLTQYLQEVKNISEAQLDTIVWPAELYSTLAFMLPIGLAAEYIGYVPVIFLGLLCREATRVVLIFSNSLTMMVMTQITYAIATVANSILISYLYRVIPDSSFLLGSLLFRASYTGGNMIGSALGQLLFDYADFSLKSLFYASWVFTSIGVFLFIFFRPIPIQFSNIQDTNLQLSQEVESTPEQFSKFALSYNERSTPNSECHDDPLLITGTYENTCNKDDILIGFDSKTVIPKVDGVATPHGENFANESPNNTDRLLQMSPTVNSYWNHREKKDKQSIIAFPHVENDASDFVFADNGSNSNLYNDLHSLEASNEHSPLLSSQTIQHAEESCSRKLSLRIKRKRTISCHRRFGRGPVARILSTCTIITQHKIQQYINLYTHPLVVLWSIWWAFAYGSNVLFGNYYQTLLYNHYTHVPFGWIECGIEFGGTMGNIIQIGIAHRYASSPTAPLLAALCLAAAAAFSQVIWSSLWPTALGFGLFFAVFEGSHGLASAGIAAHLSEQRYALVFTTNSFFSLSLMAMISAIASHLNTDTLGYFRIIMGMTLLGLLAIAIPLCLVTTNTGRYRTLKKAARE